MDNQKGVVQLPEEFALPAALLRGANVCRAGNKGLRYCLRGIHINNTGWIESSDGHTCFRASCEQARTLEASVIVQIEGEIPRLADRAVFVVPEEEKEKAGDRIGYVWFSNGGKVMERGGFPVRRWFRLIDGRFPDLDRIVPKGPPEPVASAMFKTEYLTRADKIASAMGSPWPAVRFEFYGDTMARAEIRHPEHPALLLVMGMRE